MDNYVFPNLQGMGSANFMEMQQRMQRELMSNPDTLRQVILSILNGLEQTYTFALFTRTFVWLLHNIGLIFDVESALPGAWQPGDPELDE